MSAQGSVYFPSLRFFNSLMRSIQCDEEDLNPLFQAITIWAIEVLGGRTTYHQNDLLHVTFFQLGVLVKDSAVTVGRDQMEVAYDNMLHFLELNFNNGANRAIYFDLIHIGAFVRAVRYDWITSKGDFLRYHGRINNPNSFSKLKGM